MLEHRLRLGGPGGTERSVHVYANTRSYSYLAKEHGASTARQLASNLVPWLWQTEFQDGGRVDVNSRGELMSYYRRAVPADSELSQRLDARAVAERALIDAWRQQPSSLTLERSSAGGQISSFSWESHQSV